MRHNIKLSSEPINRHSCYAITIWNGGLRDLEAKLNYAVITDVNLKMFFSLWHATEYDRINTIWMGTLRMYVQITNGHF